MIKLFLNIIHLFKSIIGVFLIFKSVELYNNGYVNNGIIDGLNTFVGSNPELVTMLAMCWVALWIMR